MRHGSGEVNRTNEHSNESQNVQGVLEDDESFDVFRIPGSDAMNLQGCEDNEKDRKNNCSYRDPHFIWHE